MRSSVDNRHRLPFAHGLVPVAADEACAHRGTVVDPPRAAKLVRELRGQVDVRHQLPHADNGRIDDDCGLGGGPFVVSHVSGGATASPPARVLAAPERAGPRDGAVVARDPALVQSRRSGSRRTTPRPARSWQRWDGPRCVRARTRAAPATSRSNRCGHTPRTGADGTTTRLIAHTLRTRFRSEPPSGRPIRRSSCGSSQLEKARYSWTDRTAADPSPTAA